MVKPEIISETPITMAEIRSELERIQKRDGELNFRANKTQEYLNHFIEQLSDKIVELKEKLTGLKIPRLKEEHIVKIVDLLPTTVEDLKVILQGYVITVNNENMKKVVDVVNQFVGKGNK